MGDSCRHNEIRGMTGCAGYDLETGEKMWICAGCGEQWPTSKLPFSCRMRLSKVLHHDPDNYATLTVRRHGDDKT